MARAGDYSAPDAKGGTVRSCRYLAFMNARSPIVSEFATAEEQAAYGKWLAGKVAASLADDSLPVAHDEAMAQARAIIEQSKRRSVSFETLGPSTGSGPRSSG
jgi:hypothetical protein